MLIKQDAQTIHTVVLDDCRNTIEEFVAVARYHAKVEFSQGYRDRVTASRKSLEATIASGVGVYGVNTGFGDNVRYRITEDEMVQLQENILRSHGCSVGRALSEEEARALMLMQLMSIGKGYSAVSLEMLEQIRTYLNADLYPYAPCEGTVGGLSFQPYIAITYMGEGRLFDGGKVRPTAEVLKEKGIAPLKVKAREGLALLSNASHSLGVGLLALYDFVMTMLTALQAIDLSDHKAMSPVTQKVHDHARQTVTFMENDDLMYQRIEAMEHLVESNQLLADCPVPFTI